MSLQLLNNIHVMSNSSNTVIKTKYKGTVRGFFKACDTNYPPKLAQIEAAMSLYYRLVLGNKAANVAHVQNTEGEVTGVFSIEIPDFKSMFESAPGKEALKLTGIANMLVASYVREEEDLHPGNIGLKGRIDFDMSAYPIGYKYKGERLVTGTITPRPEKAFIITANDIENFPVIKNAVPCFWPTYSVPGNGNLNKIFRKRNSFIQLKDDTDFIKDKFFAFLKEVVINKTMLEKTMSLNIKDADLLKTLVDHFSTRIKTLRSVLLDVPQFIKYFYSHPEFLDQCLGWFKTYNENYSRKGGKINLSEIKAKYLCLWRDGLRRKIILDLLPLHEFINSLSQSSKERFPDLKLFYESLISGLKIYFREENLDNRKNQEFIEECAQKFILFKNRSFEVPEKSSEWKMIKSSEWKMILNNIWKCIQKFNHKNRKDCQWKCSSLSEISDIKDDFTKSEYFPQNNKLFQNKNLYQSCFIINKVELNYEEVLSKKLKKWLANSLNLNKIIHVAEKSLEEYKPSSTGSLLGYINPYCYSRQRTPDISRLIKKLTNSKNNAFSKIVQLLSEGKWNTGRRESFNTTFMKNLCKTMLEEISFDQLLDGTEIVRVSYGVLKNGEDLSEKVENIYKRIVDG